MRDVFGFAISEHTLHYYAAQHSEIFTKLSQIPAIWNRHLTAISTSLFWKDFTILLPSSLVSNYTRLVRVWRMHLTWDFYSQFVNKLKPHIWFRMLLFDFLTVWVNEHMFSTKVSNTGSHQGHVLPTLNVHDTCLTELKLKVKSGQQGIHLVRKLISFHTILYIFWYDLFVKSLLTF